MQFYKNAIVDHQILLQCDGSLYIGDCINGQFNGQSVTYFPDGSYYQGQFLESVPKKIGLYKLKNSCLKIQWNNYGQISSITQFDNRDFIYELLDFEKSEYGNILKLKKTDKFAYGAKINGKFEGFCIHEFQNKIYYGYFENGLPNNYGILYDTNWVLGIFKNGKLVQKLKSGSNMPPKEEIIELFKRSHKNYKHQHEAPLLSTIQRMILDYLTHNNTKSTFYTHNSNNSLSMGNPRSDSGRITDRIINRTKSGYEAVSSENTILMSQSEQQDDDLGYYKQESERTEEQINNNKLTKQETEEALNRLSTKKSNGFEKATPLSRVNFRKQLSQKNINQKPTQRQRTHFSQSPIKIIITRRSTSPAFVTFRPLFTMVRL